MISVRAFPFVIILPVVKKTPTEIRSINELPTNVDDLRRYSWDLTLAFQQLSEKYRLAVARLYGRSSEKASDTGELDALQMEMDELLAGIAKAEEKIEQEREKSFVTIPAHKRRLRHPGRNAIPEDLITEVTIDVSDEEKSCGCCGKPMTIVDTKKHVVVERIPASYKATRYLRPVYGCGCCKDRMAVAEPVALPIPKGIAGPNLMAFVVLSKYLYHLTLYRIQRQIYHESRIWFTRSTLSGWMRGICSQLERIHKALLSEYRSGRVKHADETPLQYKYEKVYRTGYMWVGLSGDGRIAVFLFDQHRSGKAAEKLLSGSSKGDVLMIDDFVGYRKVVKSLGLLELRCMGHIRRNFIDAVKAGAHQEFNERIVRLIRQLYRVERIADRANADAAQRLALRQRLSAGVTEQIKVLVMNPGFAVLPASATGQAINYYLRNWEAATRYLEDGELPIDNTPVERVIRHLAIGRNNWLAAGSKNGAKWMAILYSLITTCKLNGIDPHEYLADVMMVLPSREDRTSVDDLTPVNWYRARHNGAMPPRTPLYPSKN